jgi:hypothetical protein
MSIKGDLWGSPREQGYFLPMIDTLVLPSLLIAMAYFLVPLCTEIC